MSKNLGQITDATVTKPANSKKLRATAIRLQSETKDQQYLKFRRAAGVKMVRLPHSSVHLVNLDLQDWGGQKMVPGEALCWHQFQSGQTLLTAA